MNKIELPTGYLITDNYEKGQLETLSIGDYGKANNIKAQFLGYNKDINGVPNMSTQPLSEKWVITLSTQYGCTQKCTFCDVPNIKFKGNASYDDMIRQFNKAIECFPEVGYTERLNIHYARMGEPMINFKAVYEHATYLSSKEFKLNMILEENLRIETIHPVFTSMLPKSIDYHTTKSSLNKWCELKNNNFKGQAGLQLSINSTSEEQRQNMFKDSAHTLEDISTMCLSLPRPLGRKYCLNFALADDYEIDAEKLARMFDTRYWMVKITPIHKNNACIENNIKTTGGYNKFVPYQQAEKDLIKAGFDVLIFIPSEDEENSTITCGNAILGGSTIKIN